LGLLSTTSTDFTLVIGVIIANAVVQFLDNNILVPIVVSSKVQINAFVSILSIIIGGSIAGVTGMSIAIPYVAIMKVIFDRVKFLEPWAIYWYDLPKTYKWGRIKLVDLDPEKTQSKIQESTNSDSKN